MHRRDLMLLIISLLIGFFGFIMALNIIKSKSQPSFQYVVATENIVAQQVIQEHQVALSERLKNQNYSELFLTPADVVGQMASQDIPAGNLIYRTQVAKVVAPPIVESAAAEPVAPKRLEIPVGKKSFVLPSVSVELYPEGVAVGNYIDIFGIMPGPDGKNELNALVQGAYVISIYAKDSSIQTMTVAMTPDAIALVARAISNGKLRLSLGVEQEEVIAYRIGEFTEIIRGVSVSKNTLTKPSGQSSGQETVPPPSANLHSPMAGEAAAADYYGSASMVASQAQGSSEQ